MQTHPSVLAARYLTQQVRARVHAVKASDPESGALSLEWVAIAIVLVTAAVALAAFLAGKLSALESLIPN
jgi:hypothetical protein